MNEWLLGYLLLGAVAGFFAGLLGIGGGGIMVPVLAMMFAAQGFPDAHLMHLALGTSFETTLELVWQVRNASLTEFMFTEGRFTLSTFNSVAHLREPELWTYR